ncbi:MAG: hypothetical protein AB7S26_10565 [Sandaracinaceae bacterium]
MADGSLDDDPTVEEHIRSADTGPLVKAAAVVQMIAGILVALSGAQFSDRDYFYTEVLNQVPYLLIVLGLAAIGFAAMQFRARVWAGMGSAILGVVNVVAMGGWFVALVVHGALIPMPLAAAAAAGLSALLSIAAVPQVYRTARARERLARAGLDLGL